MNNKDKFLQIAKSIKREGNDKFLEYLQESDFFVAPASSKYHSNYKEGLAIHSLKVYELFKQKNDIYNLGLSEDTIKICALYHDICKIGVYEVDFRNVKDKVTGKWDKVPYYAYNDSLPIGHGDKSVIMLQQFMKLTKEEVIIIRWHMGGYVAKEDYNNVSNSWKICKAGVCLHTADLESSYLFEEIR